MSVTLQKEKAERYLSEALQVPGASFRDGQWESIESLLNGQRALVVQRTGWGKSMVYFLGTRLLRNEGKGPTLLISPLLSLMRNQLEAAYRIGLKARTINSSNTEDWDRIEEEIRRDEVDVLLISPERLANSGFQSQTMSFLAKKIGLFVIDEAHCISDWGHDFRPDYRRIIEVLFSLPDSVPVLATTATANDRVVQDVQSQLGENINLQRGSLVRKSLKLQNIPMPDRKARMAWLAQKIPQIKGSGIVYTLTQKDAVRIAQWLSEQGIKAEAYHAGLIDGEGGSSIKEELEQKLLRNEIKALVATVALGMGFDKPDLGFVIHFQRPSSVVHYYQQVGRAGRAVEEAYGILLSGEEDDRIADYFIKNAFPPQKYVSQILEVLAQHEDGLSIPAMQKELNLGRGRLEKTLKFLSVESPCPVVKVKSKWQLTPFSDSYKVDQERLELITGIRRAEQKQMQDYMTHDSCLMAYLQDALDDPQPQDCGKCSNCNPKDHLDSEVDQDLMMKAGVFLKRNYQEISPRKRWPVKNMFHETALTGFKIPEAQQMEAGYALCVWRDAGWGELVARGKTLDGEFNEQLVKACEQMLNSFEVKFDWVCAIPSLRSPDLVPGFAKRLASSLNIPFHPVLKKVKETYRQTQMDNSFQQVANLDGAFEIDGEVSSGRCLLVDDVHVSGWTLTLAGALLGKSGAESVTPLTLAVNPTGLE